MKSTGFVRRIDQLGRVVIPKEIRSSSGFTEGQPLEFFTENGEIILKKYNVALTVNVILKALRETISEEYEGEKAEKISEKIKELSSLLDAQE
jgi:AbrB family looped-hinge helix DNA binding protein